MRSTFQLVRQLHSDSVDLFETSIQGEVLGSYRFQSVTGFVQVVCAKKIDLERLASLFIRRDHYVARFPAPVVKLHLLAREIEVEVGSEEAYIIIVPFRDSSRDALFMDECATSGYNLLKFTYPHTTFDELREYLPDAEVRKIEAFVYRTTVGTQPPSLLFRQAE